MKFTVRYSDARAMSAPALGCLAKATLDNDYPSDGMGMFHRFGEYRVDPRQLVRALTASAVIAGALTLAGCLGDDGYQLPTRAMKELSPQRLASSKRRTCEGFAILVRVFKKESSLKSGSRNDGPLRVLKVYPIYRWTGDLRAEGQGRRSQAPEGFSPSLPG